jgi:hypothetical protein
VLQSRYKGVTVVLPGGAYTARRGHRVPLRRQRPRVKFPGQESTLLRAQEVWDTEDVRSLVQALDLGPPHIDLVEETLGPEPRRRHPHPSQLVALESTWDVPRLGCSPEGLK